jgi:hypothetical protein
MSGVCPEVQERAEGDMIMQEVVVGIPAGVWMTTAVAVGCYVWCGGIIKLRLGWLEVVLHRWRR